LHSGAGFTTHTQARQKLIHFSFQDVSPHALCLVKGIAAFNEQAALFSLKKSISQGMIKALLQQLQCYYAFSLLSRTRLNSTLYPNIIIRGTVLATKLLNKYYDSKE